MRPCEAAARAGWASATRTFLKGCEMTRQRLGAPASCRLWLCVGTWAGCLCHANPRAGSPCYLDGALRRQPTGRRRSQALPRHSLPPTQTMSCENIGGMAGDSNSNSVRNEAGNQPRFSLNLIFVEAVVAGFFHGEGDAALGVGGGGVGFAGEEVGEAEGFVGDVAEGDGGGGFFVV